MRLIFCIALLALAPITLAKRPTADTSKQFIDKSVVSYPKVVGDYTLHDESYDPSRLADGVSLAYAFKDVTAHLQFNIYIYPLGRASEADALTGAMQEVEAAIRDMEKQQVYANVQFDDIGDFPVPAPRSFLDKDDIEQKAKAGPKDDAAATTTAAAPVVEADKNSPDFLKDLIPATTLVGRKRPLRFMHNGQAMRSLAYVFYSQLFLIKVRASVAAADMPADAFVARVDRAVQDLVPKMAVHNFGKCGTMMISFPAGTGDKKKDDEANARELFREMGRIGRENCSNSGPDEPAPEGREQQVIVFPADTWK